MVAANKHTNKVPDEKSVDDNYLIKKIQENGSRIILLFLLIWNIFIFTDVKNSIRNFYQQKEAIIDEIGLLCFIAGFLFCIVINKSSRYLFKKHLNVFISNSLKGNNGAYNKNEELLLYYLEGFVYHLSFFVILFYHMKGSEYMPRAFGGTYDLKTQYQDYPQNISNQLKNMYFIAIGHSSEKLIRNLLFDRHKNDFMPLLMHHYITVSLIAYSYFSKHFIPGLPILLLHSSTDILLYPMKFYRDFVGYKSITLYICYFSFFAVWVYSRLFAYHFEVYCPLSLVLLKLSKEYFFLSLYLLFCCTALSFLNILWFAQIIKSLLNFISRRRKKTGN